ncbi:hypothetical protein [Rhizobium mesoamericanum]|uniref:hypothetical protein n=1 Tax=Rhizobium mesoamericanum TaxID=1079800 RepID=UPI0003093F21|nr:hypothetical protein [Rhizobium mesoamericanum]
MSAKECLTGPASAAARTRHLANKRYKHIPEEKVREKTQDRLSKLSVADLPKVIAERV